MNDKSALGEAQKCRTSYVALSVVVILHEKDGEKRRIFLLWVFFTKIWSNIRQF